MATTYCVLCGQIWNANCCDLYLDNLHNSELEILLTKHSKALDCGQNQKHHECAVKRLQYRIKCNEHLQEQLNLVLKSLVGCSHAF